MRTQSSRNWRKIKIQFNTKCKKKKQTSRPKNENNKAGEIDLHQRHEYICTRRKMEQMCCISDHLCEYKRLNKSLFEFMFTATRNKQIAIVYDGVAEYEINVSFKRYVGLLLVALPILLSQSTALKWHFIYLLIFVILCPFKIIQKIFAFFIYLFMTFFYCHSILLLLELVTVRIWMLLNVHYRSQIDESIKNALACPMHQFEMKSTHFSNVNYWAEPSMI